MYSRADEFVWTERYRPSRIAEVILPAIIKNPIKKFVEKGNLPNMMFVGGPGVGKTTLAIAAIEELGADYLLINASKDRNIDTLRNEIESFASSMSMKGGRKYVILDEADNLNPTSTQPALRAFMEEFSANCGFILTLNYPSKIIEALHSRCSVINFRIEKDESAKMAHLFMQRLEGILDQEGVKYDKPVLAKLIMKWFPDWRRALNELQKYAVTGAIDTGIFSQLEGASLEELVEFMKKKEFSNVRKWVGENSDRDDIYRALYDAASSKFTKKSIPQLVITLAKYQYQSAFAVDPEINLTACLAEVMIDAEWSE